jgi:glycosyltransferase involved in cell wall biosynthesis
MNNMKDEPLVSIIVPVYNREDYIDDCLRSALRQIYPNIEVIVVDNNSSDSTWGIVGKIAAQDSRVRRFRNEVNLGPIRNWEQGLIEAKGVFAMFLWSDDLIAPTFVSKTVPQLEQNSDAGFVCTGLEVFFDDHRYRDAGYRIGPSGVYPCSVYRQGVLADLRFSLSPGCALFRLKDLRRNLTLVIPNKQDIDLTSCGVGADLLFYLKATRDYPMFVFIDEPLAFFRSHSGSITKASRAGAVPLLYALTKTQFLESIAVLGQEMDRHNAFLFLLTARFRHNPFGFRECRDFYSRIPEDLSIDWKYMLWIAIRYICHEVFRILNRIRYVFSRRRGVDSL